MILVQISDTHIDEPGALVYGHFDTSRALARAVDVINAMDPGPDLVLHTGDIASHGSVPRYQAFKEIVGALNVPLAVIPGNHDERNALRQVFGGTSSLPTTGDFLHYVIEDHPVRIICALADVDEDAVPDSRGFGGLPGLREQARRENGTQDS